MVPYIVDVQALLWTKHLLRRESELPSYAGDQPGSPDFRLTCGDVQYMDPHVSDYCMCAVSQRIRVRRGQCFDYFGTLFRKFMFMARTKRRQLPLPWKLSTGSPVFFLRNQRRAHAPASLSLLRSAAKEPQKYLSAGPGPDPKQGYLCKMLDHDQWLWYTLRGFLNTVVFLTECSPSFF